MRFYTALLQLEQFIQSKCTFFYYMYVFLQHFIFYIEVLYYKSHAGKINFCRSASPLAQSISNETTSKIVESVGTCDLPIVASSEIPSGFWKAS